MVFLLKGKLLARCGTAKHVVNRLSELVLEGGILALDWVGTYPHSRGGARILATAEEILT